jgi:signal transduction histidine kinase
MTGLRAWTYARSVVTPQASASGSSESPPNIGVLDVLLGVGLGAFVSLVTFGISQGQTARRPFDVLALALVLVAAGALIWRRRRPVLVATVVFGALVTYFAFGYPHGPVWLILIVAYLTAIIRGYRLAAAALALAGFLVFPWLDFVLRDGDAPSFVSMAALAAWLIVLLGVGEAFRIRRVRAEEAIRIREEETRRRASEERLRIARELHDALGHHLSLINVQAGVALHVDEGLSEQTRGSLSAIKDASKEALTELRSVLDILRQQGERAPRSPTSTLTRLDDLVAQASAAGLDVRTETDGDPRPLPFGVDVAAYRIVQEALTNVAKHAGPTAAKVRVAYGDRDLTVQVDDEGAGVATDAPPGNGSGIRGMRERVAALGGELEAGPRPGGGFRVSARLPLEDVAG